MTVVKVICPNCGPQDIGNADVTLTKSNAGWAYYSFTCKVCSINFNVDANPRAVALLESINVTTTYVHVPDEFLEERHGPALTYDDLLDFALELGEDWFVPTMNLTDDEKHPMTWPGPA